MIGFDKKINNKGGLFNDNNLTDAAGMSPAAQEASPNCGRRRKRSPNLRFEEVCRAASEIERTGRRPTAYNVRNLPGRGSYTTILNMLRRRSGKGVCTQGPRSGVTEPHSEKNRGITALPLYRLSMASMEAITALLEHIQGGAADADLKEGRRKWESSNESSRKRKSACSFFTKKCSRTMLPSMTGLKPWSMRFSRT